MLYKQDYKRYTFLYLHVIFVQVLWAFRQFDKQKSKKYYDQHDHIEFIRNFKIQRHDGNENVT